MIAEFDKFKKDVFHQTLTVMGEGATWQCSDGSVKHGRVLFKNPTMPATIGNADYVPVTPSIEYFKDTFEGLKQAVDAQPASREFVIIRDTAYLVTAVETKFDGDTFLANLELSEQ